jgi:ferredoxin
MALTILTERSRCSGHARCNSIAPHLFTIDERGYVDLPEETAVPEGEEEQAQAGVESCPEHVFRLRQEP